MGASPCHMSILRNANVTYVSVAYFPLCHMSNSGNGDVACHCLSCIPSPLSHVTISMMSYVDFKKRPYCLVEIKGNRVNMRNMYFF